MLFWSLKKRRYFPVKREWIYYYTNILIYYHIIMVSKGTEFPVTRASLRPVCNKARKHWRERNILFNFLAAVLLNIVTQSTEGSIKTHLSLQFLKMNSNLILCISCLQKDGKRFLGSNRKISQHFLEPIHSYRLTKIKLLWHFQQFYRDNSVWVDTV